jgi:hypothetical protein
MATASTSPAPCATASRRRVLVQALLLGALCRALCACISLSFHGRDDYFHVLQPALLWLDNPNFDWQHSGLPGAGYRSHLLPRLVYWLLLGLRALGIQSPTATLRGLYLAMGAYSLLIIPALYSAGARLFDAQTARRAAFMGAVFFVLPYAGTRLLIEGLAMPPLMFSLALCASRRGRTLALAGLCMGLACWWRLQVLTAALGALLGLALQVQRGTHSARSRLGFIWGLGAAALLQGGFDWLSMGQPFAPLWQNILINLHPDATLSRSAPWGSMAALLALTLPPLTVWLLPGMLKAVRQAPPLGCALGCFLLFHSLVPHKEDRFLLPVVPLIALLMAAVPQMLRQPWAPQWEALRRWSLDTWPVAQGLGLGLGGLALGLALTSQSQQNLRDTMEALHHDTAAQGVVSLGPEVQEFFAGRPLQFRQSAHPTESWLLRSLAELQAVGATPNRFIAYRSDRLETELWLRLIGFTCEPPQRLDGWWFDRLLCRLNPRRNRRREPTYLYRCTPPQVEVAQGLLPAEVLKSSVHKQSGDAGKFAARNYSLALRLT